MANMQLNDLFERATLLAQDVGAWLHRNQSRRWVTQRKVGTDIVTNADLQAEEWLVKCLSELTPDASILSEERESKGTSGEGATWIVDPLDGTVNYAAGLPWYGVSIAFNDGEGGGFAIACFPGLDKMCRAMRNRIGEPEQTLNVSKRETLSEAIVSVNLTGHFPSHLVGETARLLEDLSIRARGVRVVVCAAYELALVSWGLLDGFISLKSDQYSVAAGLTCVAEAKGMFTNDVGGAAEADDCRLVVSNGRIHEEILGRLRCCGVSEEGGRT